jgi:hypothetical protein
MLTYLPDIPPATAPLRSLSPFVPKPAWESFVAQVIAAAHERCQSCKKKVSRFDGLPHERWFFDYQTLHQVYLGTDYLCRMCHACKHPVLMLNNGCGYDLAFYVQVNYDMSATDLLSHLKNSLKGALRKTRKRWSVALDSLPFTVWDIDPYSDLEWVSESCLLSFWDAALSQSDALDYFAKTTRKPLTCQLI